MRSLARSRVKSDPCARGLGQGVLDIVRTACGLQRLRGEREESEDQGAEALGATTPLPDLLWRRQRRSCRCAPDAGCFSLRPTYAPPAREERPESAAERAVGGEDQ